MLGKIKCIISDKMSNRKRYIITYEIFNRKNMCWMMRCMVRFDSQWDNMLEKIKCLVG